MNCRGGFIGILFLILAAAMLIGGAYVYMQKNQVRQPMIENITLPLASSTTSTPDSQMIAPQIQTPSPQPKIETVPPPVVKPPVKSSTPKPPTPVIPPTVIQCDPPFTFPSAPNGGLTYVNWHFNIPDIHTLQFQVKIDNDPGPKSDLFLQLYDGNIDGSGQYFGLQTTGLVLFSRFGTASPQDASVPAGSTLSIDGNPNNGEGSTYISIRRSFGSLPAGTYSVRMTRDTYDGIGDWFRYYVTFPGSSERYVGEIRFPRAEEGVPASFHDGGGTWTEFWDNNSSTLFPVPLWHVRTAVTANGSTAPASAVSAYSAMPNSDVYTEVGGFVDHVIGGCTRRVHPPGSLSF